MIVRMDYLNDNYCPRDPYLSVGGGGGELPKPGEEQRGGHDAPA